jgi:hypothetical protein
MSSTTEKGPLLIPVENQIRELDSEILPACIAAQRGFPSYIGSRRQFHLLLIIVCKKINFFI